MAGEGDVDISVFAAATRAEWCIASLAMDDITLWKARDSKVEIPWSIVVTLCIFKHISIYISPAE